MVTAPSKARGASGPQLRAVLPLVWELVSPRRGLLAVGFVLMAINRVASLVLPYSTRYLIDSVVIPTPKPRRARAISAPSLRQRNCGVRTVTLINEGNC